MINRQATGISPGRTSPLPSDKGKAPVNPVLYGVPVLPLIYPLFRRNDPISAPFAGMLTGHRCRSAATCQSELRVKWGWNVNLTSERPEVQILCRPPRWEHKTSPLGSEGEDVLRALSFLGEEAPHRLGEGFPRKEGPEALGQVPEQRT